MWRRPPSYLSVAELIGAFFTARATPVIALGSTFIDFTPPWMKDFAIATFGTNDKAALFVGMGLTIFLLACVLGVVAYRRWALGVAGVLLMGTVIVASVVTRASVKPLDAIPTVLGTLAGLVVLRLLIAPLWRTRAWPDAPADTAAKEPEPSRHAAAAGFFAAAGITAAAAGIAATGGRLLSAARSNIAQARESLQLPAPVKAAAAVPAGVQSPVAGVTPWVTPNGDFYRIDTALSVPEINADDWELRVHGLVEEEVRLTFQDLLDADLIESHVTLTCVSNPVGGNLAGNAKWLGLPIREVLKRARPKDGADMVLSTSIDGFSASTPLEVLQDDRDAMLAIGMNGEPLPLEHGYPVRMVVPGPVRIRLRHQVGGGSGGHAFCGQQGVLDGARLVRARPHQDHGPGGGPQVVRQGSRRPDGHRRHRVGPDPRHHQGGGPDRQRGLGRGRAVRGGVRHHLAAVVLRVGRHARPALHQSPRHGRNRRGADGPARRARTRRRVRLAVGHGHRGVARPIPVPGP